MHLYAQKLDTDDSFLFFFFERTNQDQSMKREGKFKEKDRKIIVFFLNKSFVLRKRNLMYKKIFLIKKKVKFFLLTQTHTKKIYK